MERVIPMSWLNQILLVFSISAAILSLVIQGWVDFTPLPIYVSISWAIFVTIISIWLSCYLLRLTLKANSPIAIEFMNKWICKKLVDQLSLDCSVDENESIELTRKGDNENQKNSNSTQKDSVKCKNDDSCKKENSLTRRKKLNVIEMTQEINAKYIEIWYKNISNDKSFPDEAQNLLIKFLTRLVWKASLIDKIKLTNKLASVLLLHLKEYRRALRRVEKGTAVNVEEAYKYLHPGSRSTSTLEHMLHRLVTVLAQEFLQWELTSSLPCKLLLSILAKKLLTTIDIISSPDWLIENLLRLLEAPTNEVTPVKQNINGTITVALSDGITSATAAVIPQQLPKSLSKSSLSTATTSEDKNTALMTAPEKPTLCLEGLSTEHRGLWGDSITDTDLDLEEDKISPVYEEPTDFATTIARLRSLLQQKSTATTPLHAEEKSYVIYEGSQFTNLSIPWTEFHTATDGSQQLYYCIQFDDVEQRGMDLFETTTATVKRQYADFVQLHLSLEEIPTLASIMSELVLPEGGRIELEMYLKTLCTRLATECPPQLRHFLRPSSSASKKADAVAPRLDRFLAKTVTGVFNTLKTVVPGFELDQEEDASPPPTLMPLSDIPWRFVEDIKSKSLACELQQLIAERTEYCTVDTAYEAVDSIEASGDSELLDCWWETINTSYDDEIDELDSNLTLTCTTVDLICELLAGIASNNTLQQEAVVRWTKLLLGNISEPILQKIIWSFYSLSGSPLNWDTSHNITSQNSAQLRDKLLCVLKKKISYNIKLIFGEDDAYKALNYLLSSYEIKRINLDLNMQMLDALVSELLISCKTNYDAAN
ncbi:uncharacterized protein LOC105834089 [Monomorium pharaonis]|uniref:uncharacterized protein LOC105834089 n=1 Tax=Monomorium pharaonis TaxID=307658 RepID=UPI00063F35C0|nr:uncharacterized protein LOC105834089 [Monomorium pharaonis]XP_036147500.1 uncharacterized protein LOC105834089 [Monomorium pharaonis]XP_036147501.1 uncharacterized protein LOC105834089 [Monomorium pharaonis]